MPAALPPAARVLADVVTDAVGAACSGDRAAFDDALRRLALLDPEYVRLLLGGIVRALLEEQHAEGLDGDDLRALIEDAMARTSRWWPEVDAAVLLVVVAGALGVHPEPDELPGRPPTPDEVTAHACVLVADRLGAVRRLGRYVEAAFAEIARAETVELP